METIDEVNSQSTESENDEDDSNDVNKTIESPNDSLSDSPGSSAYSTPTNNNDQRNDTVRTCELADKLSNINLKDNIHPNKSANINAKVICKFSLIVIILFFSLVKFNSLNSSA